MAVTIASERMTNLDLLEAESMHILREAVAQSERPVMMYSVGTHSWALLPPARRAFYPAPPPFPLLHVDTTWKFREMYAFRDQMARESGIDLLVHINQRGLDEGIGPFTH